MIHKLKRDNDMAIPDRIYLIVIIITFEASVRCVVSDDVSVLIGDKLFLVISSD